MCVFRCVFACRYVYIYAFVRVRNEEDTESCVKVCISDFKTREIPNVHVKLEGL